MSEVDYRIWRVRALGSDPTNVISPEDLWFAWYPVRLGPAYNRNGGWRWLCTVKRFRPLGMFNEYSDVVVAT